MSNDRDRTVRRLTALEHSASTSRVLNLLSIHRKFADDPSLVSSPFFHNRLLDRALILKHRLRPHEMGYFRTARSTATKVLIPIDATDLKFGAQSFFVGQIDFDRITEPVFGEDLKVTGQDRRTLELIDAMPSLDPFLLREHLRTNHIEPSKLYFGISESDIQRMFAFVREEILALVVLSAGGSSTAHFEAGRFVDKLLSSAPDGGFLPLKDTLKLSQAEYSEGVFSWRGFLYYKWCLSDLRPQITDVLSEIATLQGRGPRSAEAATYVPEARTRILNGIVGFAGNVDRLLGIYDHAYAGLTRDGDPGRFRDFLLGAPAMFAALGEQLGAVQHVTSFWRYRFPRGRPRVISHEELMDLFLDFEDCINAGDTDSAAAAPQLRAAS